jgi:vacuolar-type H+-ATPase subunit H
MPDNQDPAPTAGKSRRSSPHEHVGSIISAAEATADRITDEAERRVRERIAEGQRAADNRVRAAEEEAAEILASARIEADRLRRSGQEEAEQAKTSATSEALTIVANAEQNADETLEQATTAAANSQREAERYSRELMSEARTTAEDVRSEGLELVANLRQMGDSLRANAERILRDVQSVHKQMVARIEQAEGDGRGAAAAREVPAASRRPRSDGAWASARARFESPADDGVPDVPEFIPRR